MNTKHFASIFLLTGLLLNTFSAPAEDIDIYSGLGTSSNTANIIVVVDNPSSQNNNVGPCTYWDGTTPSQGSKALGNDQCALANIVYNMTKKADGSALFNIGMTTMDGVILKLTPLDDKPFTGTTSVALGSTTYTIPSGSTNRQAIIVAVKALNTTMGSSGQGTELQETWAYYTGGNGTFAGTNTATGLLSGITYPGTNATSGCQKNYIIYLSNVKANASHAQDNGELVPLDAVARNALAFGSLTIAQIKAIDPSYPGYTGAIPNKPQAGFGIEWARMMNSVDVNTTSLGLQGVVTYSVATGDTAAAGTPITSSMELYIKAVADYGGGKYYAAGLSYTELENNIKKILNEVQATNSVFSSSSLPVSVNSQGTFLNQIYMGMFRPDAGAQPRWGGNLKQYQFILDSTTGAISIGDSIGERGISNAGTGFIDPNAISFWTCSNLSGSSNAYLSSLTTAQKAVLTSNNQSCTNVNETASGFWVNNTLSANAAAKGFDLPDGELVERGGVAQQLRNTNLTVNYATTPDSPRKLYTFCPTGSGCTIGDLTNAANSFSTNTTFVTTDFGSTLSANISSLTRSGTTVTVNTIANHGFSTGDSIAIANAAQTEYNGTFTITVLSASSFTYPVIVYPPTPATGSFTASLATTPQAVTLSRSGSTVTATAAGHGYTGTLTVTIAGTGEAAYDQAQTVTVTDANTFTFSVTETPVTTAGSGTATGEKNATGACPAPCFTTVSIPGGGVTRSGTTVTVTTSTNNGFIATVGKVISLSGVVDASGNAVPQYTGKVTTTSFNVPTNNRSFTFTVAVSPATTATGTVSTTAASKPITNLVRVANTATATVAAHGYITGNVIAISGTAGVNENAYLGVYAISNVTASTFDYAITTTPVSPGTGLSGASMTATRSTGLSAGSLNDLINWVRGKDNQADEQGPGGTTTIRPSVHGDVLHSRPTVINYGSYPISITATSDSGTTRTATASSTDVTTINSFGAYPIVTFANGQACPVTITTSTSFTYLATSCGASGAQSANAGSKVVVFYGDNTGVFHAVNGNQSSDFAGVKPGNEIWGFIPREHFIKLNRQRTNSPQLNLPSTPPGISPTPKAKDYFVDGTPGVYQLVDGSGTTTQAILYLSMRRGGDFIYALDVTTPASPTVLWKIDTSGITKPSGFTSTTDYSELGQTWSKPKVAKVKGYCGGITCSPSILPTPVLIFGGGYDTNEDVEPPANPGSTTAGKAIFILDALTGALVWKATIAGTDSCSGTTYKASCGVSAMKYGMPSDITLIDKEGSDGYIDRLYAADTGGNIWRVDLEPSGTATPDNWRVRHFAALGCDTGACSLPTTPKAQRKFFYPPEVVGATTANNYDVVIAGSGDREHPLNNGSTTESNRMFVIKDIYTGNNASSMTPITINGTDKLFDAGTASSATTNSASTTSWDGTLNGYYITLVAGEKVINAPLFTAGFAYMSTNQPAPSGSTTCNGSLGVATGYQLSLYSGSYIKSIFEGGGLPASPVAGVVGIVNNGVVKLVRFLIGGACPTCKTGLDTIPPKVATTPKRTRTYRYMDGK